MRVSCLMPTFNRFPALAYLIEEAVESFIRQDYPNRELLICNDAPGQKLVVAHPQVKVFNLGERMQSLPAKLRFLIEQAQGEVLCRWDDDDISLPHRLTYSMAKLNDQREEWRAENYFFDCGTLTQVVGPANTHVTSVFTRACLKKIGGYPLDGAEGEDQAFNRALADHGMGDRGETIDFRDIFYIYRWSTGSQHLSGLSGPQANVQTHYEWLGKLPIAAGTYTVHPRWYRNHVERVRQAARIPVAPKPYSSIRGHFDYEALYDYATARSPRGGSLVEVGCFQGRSLAYLGVSAKGHGKRLTVYGVDLGLGDDQNAKPPEDFGECGLLAANLREAGVQDIVSLLLGESTAMANVFVDQSLDFIFIDGNHSYSDVRSDLQCWFPKLKPGGLMAGHDYVNPEFPGVARAVDEFFGVPSRSMRSPRSPSCWETIK